MDPLRLISTRRNAQRHQADPRQVINAAGGYTFTVDDLYRLHRFLTLGTDGGTFYTRAPDLTRDNADVVFRAAATDPVGWCGDRRGVDGRPGAAAEPGAVRLAIAASAEDVDGGRAALAALPTVARTGTHLFLFASYVEQFRGWGPTLRKAVARWYTDMPIDKLAYQLVKYRHATAGATTTCCGLPSPGGVTEPARRMAFNWTARKGLADYPNRAAGAGQPAASDRRRGAGLAGADRRFRRGAGSVDGAGLGRHHQPGPWPVVGNAARRGSGRAAGVACADRSGPAADRVDAAAAAVDSAGCARWAIPAGSSPRSCRMRKRLKRARVHPINVLVAQRTYAAGQSARGRARGLRTRGSPTRLTRRSTTPTARSSRRTSASCWRWTCPAR